MAIETMIVKSTYGAVLAGGHGRRMGSGGKLRARLGDRFLLEYPLGALREVCDEVVLVAKADTLLPPLDVAVLREPARPVHPLVGIVCALRAADGRDVLIAAGDLPFLTAEVLRTIAAASGPAAVACGPDSGPQPLLGVYRAAALERLAPLAEQGRAPMRAVVRELGATLVPVSEAALVNVNTPEELEWAAAATRT